MSKYDEPDGDFAYRRTGEIQPAQVHEVLDVVRQSGKVNMAGNAGVLDFVRQVAGCADCDPESYYDGEHHDHNAHVSDSDKLWCRAADYIAGHKRTHVDLITSFSLWLAAKEAQ